MNLEKFTDRAKGFLQAAQTIAIRMSHQRISPEHIAKALLQGHGAAAGLREFVQLGSHELLASSVVVFFTFIPFFAFKELERAIGKGALWNLFFGMRAAKST